MNTCPSLEGLRRLLLGELNGPLCADLEAHVEGCAACRLVMDQLTETDLALPRPEPDGTAAPREAGQAGPPDGFLERLEKELQPDLDRSDGRTRPPVETTQGANGPSGSPAPLPVIAGYVTEVMLGRGGMGVVYRATQVRPHRAVALKMVLSGAHAGPEELARFRVETEAAGRLQHRHIVQIYEVGEWSAGDGAGTVPYFSMEYLEGGSLARQLAGTPLPVRRAAELVETLARTLQYAHSRGIVHRDLTPGNVLLTPDGTPKVADFGLAKLLAGDGAARTQTGAVLGTPSYMSPEQAAGKAQAIGPTTDVYPLGAILYEALTGRPPFKAATPLETIGQVLHQPPVAPTQLQPRIPRDLETICITCLQKEPARRYATAEALADDLQRFRADRPIQARRSGVAERGWRWCRRNPVLAAMTASAALLLVAVAVVSLVAALRLNERQKEATDKLWESLRAQAKAGRFSRRQGQRFDSLRALEEAAKIRVTPELRNEAIACLALPDVRIAKEWEGYPPNSTNIDFDDNLERYARVNRQGHVSVRRVADDEEIIHLALGEDAWPMLSPSGRFLAAYLTSRRELQLWNLAEQKLMVVVKGKARHDFTPDETEFVVAQPDGTVVIHDLVSGKPPRQVWKGPPGGQIKVHPTLRQIAIVSPGSIQLRDLDTGNLLVDFLPNSDPEGAAWHPDGRLLAVAQADHRITLWDFVARKRVAVLEGHAHAGIRLSFSHAGDILASSCWGGVLRLWDPRTGRQLFSTPSNTPCLRFSRDDTRLAADMRGNRLGLWEVHGSHEYRTLARGRVQGAATYHGCAVSPTLDRLLAVATGSGVWLVDLADGRELAFLPVGNASLAFDSTGDLWTLWGELYRWPVRWREERKSIEIGPPKLFGKSGQRYSGQVAVSKDGRTIGLALHGRGGAIVSTNHPEQEVPLAQVDVRFVAVNPDGRWVATGSHDGPGFKIWEAATGKLAKDMPVGGIAQVTFSPDGKWLANTRAGGGYQLWEVGSWQEGPALEGTGGAMAFSPDGRILALEGGSGTISLVDPETGHESARLVDPNQDRAGALCFSPDGTRLVSANGDSQSIHVWNLEAIRTSLATREISLDIPLPGSAEPAVPLPPGILVKVQLGEAVASPAHYNPDFSREELRSMIAELDREIQAKPDDAELYVRRAYPYWRLNECVRAAADWEKAIEIDPNFGLPYSNLAAFYLQGPAEYRDVKKGLARAQRAVRLDPTNPAHVGQLALAYFLLGQWDAAIDAFHRAAEADQLGFRATHLYYLSMCYHRLGLPARASDCYQRAIRWQEQNHLRTEEIEALTTLQLEAAAVLAETPRPETPGAPPP
jgi:WD40 repeat protein/Tfp pilus assembly protein PilF